MADRTGFAPLLRLSLDSKLSLLGGGQFNPKFAAAHPIGLRAHPAPHFFDGFSDDDQTNASALIRGAGMNALEQLKKPGLIFGFDSNPIVLHPQSNVALAPLGPKLHFGSGPRVDEF